MELGKFTEVSVSSRTLPESCICFLDSQNDLDAVGKSVNSDKYRPVIRRRNGSFISRRAQADRSIRRPLEWLY
jgi:hypothetical protein